MTDITYVFAIGPGKLASQGKLLLKSILKHTPARHKDIIVYVVNEEKSKIDNNLLSFFQNNATVVEGPMPNSKYPLSAAHAALLAASKQTKNDYLLLLDVDTVLLDSVDIHEKVDAELYLKPVDLGNRYWASQESVNNWRELYDEYGFSFPISRVNSTVDNKRTLPYYNGGVILTANNNFPERWLELSNQIYGTLEESNFFTEQVSLALLSSEYDVYELTERYNHPLHLRLSIPENTKIVHYNNDTVLDRQAFFDESFENTLVELGWKRDQTQMITYYVGIIFDVLDAVYYRRTRRPSIISTVKQAVSRLLPN